MFGCFKKKNVETANERLAAKPLFLEVVIHISLLELLTVYVSFPFLTSVYIDVIL